MTIYELHLYKCLYTTDYQLVYSFLTIAVLAIKAADLKRPDKLRLSNIFRMHYRHCFNIVSVIPIWIFKIMKTGNFFIGIFHYSRFIFFHFRVKIKKKQKTIVCLFYNTCKTFHLLEEFYGCLTNNTKTTLFVVS